MDNKKVILIALGVLFAFILLFVIAMVGIGCNNKKTQTGLKTLTLWDFTNDKESFNEILKEFSDAKDVKINYVAKNQNEYLNEALNEIAAGKGPDIWTIPNNWLPKYHDKLVPMPKNSIADSKNQKTDTDVYRETYPGIVSSDNIINEQVYGVPLSIDTLHLFYNAEMLGLVEQEYIKNHLDDNNSEISLIFSNGPKNWDEFVKIVRLATQRSGDKITASAAAFGTPGITNASDIQTLLMMQNGAKMTSDDLSTAQFNTAQNVFGGEQFPGTQALKFYTSFADPKSENYTWNPELGDSLRAFAEGKTAMAFGYLGQKQDIARINPNLRYETLAVPQIKETTNPVSYASYPVYTVTKAAKNPALAWQFLLYLTEPSTADVYRSISKKPLATMSRIKDSDESFAAQAKNAQSWFMPEPTKTVEILNTMIKQVNDKVDPQTAIDGAASQITTLLGKLKTGE